MQKGVLITGIVLAGLAVALGAFGAHGLKKIVNADSVNTFQTGVQYQMYHALALIVLYLVGQHLHHNLLHTSSLFFLAGILLFSGSLYLIVALHALQKAVPVPVALMTPLGGLCFIVGWIFFLAGALKI